METFIARQPIFDRAMNVVAYELLFRSGMENRFDHDDADQACTKVLSDAYLLHGIPSLTGGKRVFVNMTREALLRDFPSLFPTESTVIEVLENVEPSPEVVMSAAALKREGYLIALDDFVDEPRFARLVELADIIKVDVLATDAATAAELVQRYAPKGIDLLAEKVETHEAFEEARDAGYHLFQGYFFAKPAIVSRQAIPEFKMHYFQILEALRRPELEIGEIEQIVKREMSLSYKLLRYLNSAFFAWSGQIQSIRQALVLLGQRDARKWLSLVTMASMADDKPTEVVLQALARGRFLESLAENVAGFDKRTQELFLMGLFSMVDAIMDRPLDELLGDLPLAGDLKEALLGRAGPLSDMLAYAVACERGDWDCMSDVATRLGLDETEMPRLYVDAVAWGREGVAASAQAA